MKRKVSLLLLIMMMASFSFFFVQNIQAAPAMVGDCLENGEDCEELEMPPAEEIEETEVETGSLSTSFAFNFIKMIFALLLVLALIYFILQFIKKRNKSYAPVQVLENVGGISLGMNKSLQIIRIGEKYYLFGIGDNVELLQEITDESVITSLEDIVEVKPMDFVQSFLSKNKKTEEETETTDFTKTLQSELAQLKEERNKVIKGMKEKDGDG